MASNGKSIHALTFDMGFTLVDLFSGYHQELIRLAACAGLTRTLQDVNDAFRIVWQEQARLDRTRRWDPTPEADEAIAFEIDRSACLHLGITDPALQAEARGFARRSFSDPTTFRIYPEVPETLARLRGRGLRLGIISNWGWWLPELCQELGIAEHFDFIISSARVGASKPHPAIFEAAVALAGTAPQHIMHVGDNLMADVRGAQNLGMTGVLLDRSGTAAAGDYPVVRRLSELLDLIDDPATAAAAERA